MNRAKVIGPCAPDLVADRLDELGVLAHRLGVGEGLAAIARLEVHVRRRRRGRARAAPRGRRACARRGARGPGRRAADAVSSRSHGSVIGVGEQEVARVPVLGRRPAALVRAEPRREEHAGVDERPVREPRRDARRGRPGPSRSRRSPSRLRGDRRFGRPRDAAERRGPEPALLDECAGPGAGAPLEAGEIRRADATRDEQLRGRIGGEDTQRREPRAHAGRRRPAPGTRDARHGALEQQQVERRVHVDGEVATGAQVADARCRRPRPASAAARCRRRGPREGARAPSRRTRSRSRRRSGSCSRARRGRRPRRPRRTLGGPRASPAGSTRRRGRRGRRARAPERAAASRVPNGVSSAGSRRTTAAAAPASRNADAVSLGERGPGVVEDGRQRPGTGVRRGGENEDGHRGGSHARSLATERCAAVGRVRAYVGLGANVGSPAETLAAAVHALAALPGARIRGVSRLYATDPVGVLDQPEFRNAVVALEVPGGRTPRPGRRRAAARPQGPRARLRPPAARAVGTARGGPRPAAVRASPDRGGSSARGPLRRPGEGVDAR